MAIALFGYIGVRGGPSREHSTTAYIVRPHPLINRGYALKTEN